MGYQVSSTTNGFQIDNLIDISGGGTSFAQYTAAGTVVSHDIYGIGLTSRVQPGSVSFFNYDGSGSIAAVTGPGGNLLASYSYLPFGALLFSTEVNPATPTYMGEWVNLEFSPMPVDRFMLELGSTMLRRDVSLLQTQVAFRVV